jgi:DNA replication protein DnaC
MGGEPVSQRATNLRRALTAEGCSEAEIREALEEVIEHQVDPDARGRAAGIPTKYRQVKWEDIEEDAARREAIESTRRWAEGTSADPGLYLWSQGFGNGKTLIAAAAAAQILDGRRRVRWLDVVGLMTDLNLPFANRQYQRAAAKLHPPAPGEVVILDDIDKIPATDRNIQPIFRLVNDCVNEEAPLIVTANRDLNSLSGDFGARFGAALASRLTGHCLDVEVSGRDRRVHP